MKEEPKCTCGYGDGGLRIYGHKPDCVKYQDYEKLAMTNPYKEIDEKFDEKVKELSNPFYLDNADGDTADFGYKTLRDNEIFTITDWGNVKKFLHEAIASAKEEGRREALEKLGELKGRVHSFFGEEYREGWNNAITDARKAIKALTPPIQEE